MVFYHGRIRKESPKKQTKAFEDGKFTELLHLNSADCYNQFTQNSWWNKMIFAPTQLEDWKVDVGRLTHVRNPFRDAQIATIWAAWDLRKVKSFYL